MKIIIKAEGEKDKVDIVFSNEELNNPNFIDLIIEGEEYTILAEDLEIVARAFMRKKISDERRE